MTHGDSAGKITLRRKLFAASVAIFATTEEVVCFFSPCEQENVECFYTEGWHVTMHILVEGAVSSPAIFILSVEVVSFSVLAGAHIILKRGPLEDIDSLLYNNTLY